MDFLVNGKALTNREARKKLIDLFNDLFDDAVKTYGFKAKLLYGDERVSEKLRPMEGHVVTGNDPSDRLTIISAYVAMPDCFPSEDIMDYPGADDPIDVYTFVGTMTAIFHERRHIDQLTMERSPESALCKIFTVNEFAQQLNSGYSKKNYSVMPTEIDAQHMALQRSYMFLKAMDGVSEEAAGTYICHYQKVRQKTVRRDFIPRPLSGEYRTVDDIFDAFAKARYSGPEVLIRSRYSFDEAEELIREIRKSGYAGFFGGRALPA